VTWELLLHGSANMIGGQAVVIQNKFELSREEIKFPDAPRSIKFASGENPKRVYGTRNQLPSTRMGNLEVMRQSFEDAKGLLQGPGCLQRDNGEG
jgi:imidazolonepropionase-like amidohydrolase